MSTIYLDNAATTQISPFVLDEMLPYLKDHYGNPSSSHSLGIEARKAKEAAREKVASLIGAEPDEVFFTSGATESNNWIINVVCKGLGDFTYFATSSVEHKSVLAPISLCGNYVSNDPSVVEVDKNGRTEVEEFSSLFDKHGFSTSFTSIIYANNEIGAIMDVEGLCKIAHDNVCLFHTDATQAIPHMKINVKQLKVDAMSGSAHKLYGPKGVGFLYVNKYSPLYRLVQKNGMILGGGQEFGYRAGTENVPGIVGLGAACEETKVFLGDKGNEQRLNRMASDLLERLKESVGAVLNVSEETKRVPTLSVWIPGVNNQELIQLLNEEGVCVSSGSACNEGEGKPSHVLSAIGLDKERINETIRISIGRNNTEEDIKTACEVIEDKVNILKIFNS